MTVVPRNSELLLTSFADDVFPGTYYGKYLFRRDDLFSYLHGYPEHPFQFGAGCLLFTMNIRGSHGIPANLYQAFTMHIRHRSKCLHCVDSFCLCKHSGRHVWRVSPLHGERKEEQISEVTCPRSHSYYIAGCKILTLVVWLQSVPFHLYRQPEKGSVTSQLLLSKASLDWLPELLSLAHESELLTKRMQKEHQTLG